MARKIFLVIVVLIPIALIVWALTDKEQGHMRWGSLITMKDTGAAEAFGMDAPGSYVGTKNNKGLHAVRGGLKMIITLSDPGVGLRAIKSRMFSSGDGLILACALVVWIISIILFLILFYTRRKKRKDA